MSISAVVLQAWEEFEERRALVMECDQCHLLKVAAWGKITDREKTPWQIPFFFCAECQADAEKFVSEHFDELTDGRYACDYLRKVWAS